MTSSSSKVNKNYIKVVSAPLKALVATTKKLLPFQTETSRLKEEVDLVTSYSSDTVYRLRYNSMNYDYISPSVVKLLGFSPEEMKEINFRSLILETRVIDENARQFEGYEHLEKMRKRGNVAKWQADYRMRTKDGRKIWVMDVSHPWFDKEGNVIGSVGSLRDITHRVEVEEKIKEQMVRLAHTDVLTGLANRTNFFENVDRELKRLQRSGSHFSILLIDLDHFKAINEQYGHAVGDKVLEQIAGIIKANLRETDIASRIGGEEFGVFLPDTVEDGAFWVAERICMEVAKHIFQVKGCKEPIHCTVSIGAASTQGDTTMTPSELYKKADTRLFIAKNTGRNQVSMDEIVQVH